MRGDQMVSKLVAHASKGCMIYVHFSCRKKRSNSFDERLRKG